MSKAEIKQSQQLDMTGATSGFIQTIHEQGCVHLLPCGICERTNKYCPIHGWSNPTVTWTTMSSCETRGKNHDK